MKKILILALSITACLSFASCGKQGDSGENVPSIPVTVPAKQADDDTAAEVSAQGSSEASIQSFPQASTQNPTQDSAGTAASKDKTTESQASMDENRKEAFVQVLENLLHNHILPDPDREPVTAENLEENKFAIRDVDGDGAEELVLLYTTDIMAGMSSYVLGYDEKTKEIRIKLMEFPELVFCDNGIIIAAWSHNQGLGDALWPYNLYQYEPESDSYVLVGMVDSWEKKVSGVDLQGNPFPDEKDTSKKGILYYIMEGNDYDTSDPVDESIYTEWISSYIGDANELKMEYSSLLQENIDKIKIR